MSNCITYEVKVYTSGKTYWYLNGLIHREDGPAIEWSNGTKYWFLKGDEYTEAEYNKKMAPNSCEGKTVTIEGKEYVLQLKE